MSALTRTIIGCWLFLGVPVVSADVPEAPASKHRAPFADSGFLPPPSEYRGRVFRLSQNYPDQLPAKERLPDCLKIDFKSQWKEYLLAVRDYCFDGNLGASDIEDDFRVADQKPPRWFHMPWQHFGPMGREGIHGLTKEAPIQSRQLAWSQTSTGQTYAVAFYNEFGASEIGRVWQRPDAPQLHDIRFPVGTVVFKLLFADIPRAQVPFLKNPVEWQGYITDTFSSTTRRVATLALIQMDIMVRDDRSPCGWLFGTFQYNGDLERANRWYNLAPVGIQWGDDPDVRDHQVNLTPIRTIRNPRLKETIINDDDKELPPTHLGWNGRLNGPVDNPMSSCMSCHATAQVRETSPLSPLFQANPPEPGSDAWMRWFQNLKCGARFDKAVPSTDFSLQLAISIKNFLQWRGEARGISATNYKYLSERAHAPKVKDPYSDTVIEDGKTTIEPKIQRNFDK
jgi:hypothetical protein